MSSKIITDDSDAILLRTELNELTSNAVKVQQPVIPAEIPAPLLSTALEENITNKSTISPPIEKSEIKILCNKDTPIKQKGDPITELPERLITSTDRVANKHKKSTVGETYRKARETSELNKTGVAGSSKNYFLDKIIQYKALLIGESGLINPNANSDVANRLKALENYF